MEMLEDSNLWDEVHAAVKSLALERAKERGYSKYRIDEESLQAFMRTIHFRPIEDEETTTQYTTHEVVYSNELNDEYRTTENREVNTRRNDKWKKEFSGKVKVDAQVPNVGAVAIGSEEVFGVAKNSEADVQKRYQQGPLSIPPRSNLKITEGYCTRVQHYELEALGSTYITVNLISKREVIGGAAGGAVGGVIGACVGAILGPPGMFLVGTIVGALGAIGTTAVVAIHNDNQFTIRAEDVFRPFSNFKQVGNKVFCHTTGSRRWSTRQMEIVPLNQTEVAPLNYTKL